MEITINDQIIIPASELHWSFSKASAPGGQGVHTTDSRVRLSWSPSETSSLSPELKRRAVDSLKCDREGFIHVVVETERSQLQNRHTALERMGDLIREAIAPPPPPRVGTKPTRSSREDRLSEKKHHSEIKKNRHVDREEEE